MVSFRRLLKISISETEAILKYVRYCSEAFDKNYYRSYSFTFAHKNGLAFGKNQQLA
jgi:hypothetical protein